MNKIEEKRLTQELQNPTSRRSAFERVVRLYSEQLYWQIRRIVLTHDDANDILQNTFLKAWDNLDFFRGDAKLSTWLYRIALNESLNHVTKQANKSQLSLEQIESDVIGQLESDLYFDGDETELLFQKALTQLPEKQRMIFNLKYFDEMKYEQISDIMGTSIGALKASYHHAVKKIEDFFRQND